MEQQIFNYKSFADSLQIPQVIVRSFEEDVRKEIPNDAMLRELHILRALKAYVRKNENNLAVQ
ncbi:MAG: hypothetical protein LBS07_01295 [Prevotellaceae bacterium]|jgi:hypothetical protein|nr:hypothetical protein [Prevotellaceae bacterium]